MMKMKKLKKSFRRAGRILMLSILGGILATQIIKELWGQS